jgi:DNA-binding IclR family transcriptional regulator
MKSLRGGVGRARDDTSFARGLRLLLSIADLGSVRAEDLAHLLDMPLSSVYRYLRTLCNFDLINRYDGVYKLGVSVKIHPDSGVSNETLSRLSDPVLRALVDQTGETAILLTRVGQAALCLHQIETPRKMRMAFERGEILPLYAGAGSRTLLAHAPPDVLQAVIDGGLPPLTGNSPSEEVLRRRLEQIRVKGIAFSRGEFIPGALAIAVPVYCNGSVVAALDVAGPESRCGSSWQAMVKELLPKAARNFGRAIERELAQSGVSRPTASQLC